jgi:hypothetical protein
MKKPPKPNIDALKIYMNAESYRIADHILRVEGQKDPNLMAVISGPHMVLSAFASELYFKCLACLETGNVPHTHNLKALFRDLSVLSRNRIEQLWNAHAPGLEPLWQHMEQSLGKKISRDFQVLLDKSSNAFTELRYAHEEPKSSFLVGDLPPMIRTVILERRPMWATLRHGRPTSLPRGMPVPPAKPP